jgi:PIN domain nuclease of toxin-antitoxin system
VKILLDTRILLWAAADELPAAAEPYIADTSNTLLFSPASLWEIVVKNGLSRDDFNVAPALLCGGLIDAGYEELPITSRHTLFVAYLPAIHKNPFDRILLAQAASEGIPLLTADSALTRYPYSVIFVG